MNKRYNYNTDEVYLAYVNLITNFPVLSAEREKELAYRIKEGDYSAREEFYNCNLKLVVKIVNKKSNNGDKIDLIQEGNEGLDKAIDKYDPSLGYKFSTYARYWIKQAIQSYNDKNSTIRVSKTALNVKTRLYTITKNYVRKNGHKPTPEESAHLLTLKATHRKTPYTVKEIEDVLENIRQADTISLNTKVGEDKETELIELRVDTEDTANNGMNLLLIKQTQEHLEKYISKLRPKEKIVIEKRFYKGLTLDKIGDELKVSRQRIQQIEERALKKLKRKMDINSHSLDDFLP